MMKELVFEGKKKIIFARPYLNKNKELEFLFSDEDHFFARKIVLNEEKKALEIREGFNQPNKKMFIMIDEKNKEFLNNCMAIKKEIVHDLKRYSKALAEGKEKIYAFKTGVEDCPYYFATESMINKGEYSEKYTDGFVYWVNKKLEGKNEPPFQNFSSMEKFYGKKFEKVKKEKYEKVNIQGEDAYQLTLDDLIAL